MTFQDRIFSFLQSSKYAELIGRKGNNFLYFLKLYM